VGVEVGVANFFLSQWIGIFLNFNSSIKIVEATVLGGLWAL